MGRISSSLSGIERVLLNRLAESTAAATLNTLHLATGQRINSPSDDPAAFMRLAGLQSQLSNVTATMSNVTAATSTVTQTETTLEAMRVQLEVIQTELLKDEERTLTPAERAAAQANIDRALDAFATLVQTEISGRRPLDGSADFVVTGRNTAQVSDVTVYSMSTTASSEARTISGSVTQAATQAELVYTGSGTHPVDDATFTLTGNRGATVISVSTSETIDEVAEKINNASHETGVVATVSTSGPDEQITFTTVDYGTEATIAITVDSGTFDVTGGEGDGTAAGTNAVATINGRTYDASSSTAAAVDGNRVDFSENGFHFVIEFAAGFTGEFDTISVEGGGLSFALSTDLNRPSTLALPGMQPALLGGPSGNLAQIASGGEYSGLGGNTSRALRIVDEALGKLTVVEGSVGAFYNAQITSASGLLGAMEVDLQEAIVETDGYSEEEELVLLAKNQTLMANAVAGLAILDQQRLAIVDLIKHIAGLD